MICLICTLKKAMLYMEALKYPPISGLKYSSINRSALFIPGFCGFANRFYQYQVFGGFYAIEVPGVLSTFKWRGRRP